MFGIISTAFLASSVKQLLAMGKTGYNFNTVVMNEKKYSRNGSEKKALHAS